MVILGFMFNYMLRVNLTIAIIAMVVPTNSSQNTVIHNDSDCTREYAAQTANHSRDQKLELPHLFHNVRKDFLQNLHDSIKFDSTIIYISDLVFITTLFNFFFLLFKRLLERKNFWNEIYARIKNTNRILIGKKL